jgi:hypothetical protein
MEIWAIKENWLTIRDFDSFEEAEEWSHKNDYFQILYRKASLNGVEQSVHVFRSNPDKKGIRMYC